MSRNSNISRAARKKRFRQRRLIALSLLMVIIALVLFLGWQVFRAINTAIATGEQNVSHPKETTVTTTTTTHATMAANAQLSSPRILVYDLTHSATLYSQNPEERCYPASLTKLLTAIVATEACQPDEVFTVGSELSLVQPGSSKAFIESGYKLTRDMIIDAMLMPSGNDAAYSIAAKVGRKLSGDPDISDLEAVFAFAERMNEKAIEIGAVNSHFSNPDGYFSPDHYTTTSDMLKIAKEALKYDNLRETFKKRKVTYKITSGQTMTFNNSNRLLNPSNPYYFEGATGMKTGYTTESGHCVIASAKRNGVEIIAVIMGGTTSNGRWADAVALLEDAFALHELTAPTTAVPAA